MKSAPAGSPPRPHDAARRRGLSLGPAASWSDVATLCAHAPPGTRGGQSAPIRTPTGQLANGYRSHEAARVIPCRARAGSPDGRAPGR